VGAVREQWKDLERPVRGRCSFSPKEGGFVTTQSSRGVPETGVSSDATVSQGRTQDQDTKSPAYGFWLAVISLALASLVAFGAMLVFKGVFTNVTDVTTVLSALFTVVGAVVGTYFGIKSSGDTRDKAQSAIEKSNETANRALEELAKK
jgi:hypothetical protein